MLRIIHFVILLQRIIPIGRTDNTDRVEESFGLFILLNEEHQARCFQQ